MSVTLSRFSITFHAPPILHKELKKISNRGFIFFFHFAMKEDIFAVSLYKRFSLSCVSILDVSFRPIDVVKSKSKAIPITVLGRCLLQECDDNVRAYLAQSATSAFFYRLRQRHGKPVVMAWVIVLLL